LAEHLAKHENEKRKKCCGAVLGSFLPTACG